MISRILYGWNIQRILFLVAGSFVLVQSIIAADWLGISMGGYFSVMGVLGLGCASGQCTTPQIENIKKTDTAIEVEYEEIKTKQKTN